MRRALLAASLLALLVGAPAPSLAQEGEDGALAVEDPASGGEAAGQGEAGAEAGTAGEAGDDHARGERTYEERRVAHILEGATLVQVPDAEAEGRRVAFVRHLGENVFVDDEGPMSWLVWANVFHVQSRRAVVMREVLLHEGEPYSRAAAEETMRNLRDLGIFTFVRVVPVRVPEDPEAVGVAVYTRDLWSLRLETGYQITGSQIDELLIQVTERNLFGMRKSASARFYLEPDAYRFGETYYDRRLANGRLSLYQSGDFIFRRETRELEGGIFRAVVERPFFDLSQRYGFSLETTLQTEIERDLRNGEVRLYDIPETLEEERIVRAYRDRFLFGRGLFAVRRGSGHRRTLSFGWDVRQLHVAPVAETGLEPGQLEAFARDVLPRARLESGPVVLYDLLTPTFHTFENLGTFGQSENARSGPKVSLAVRVPLQAFGSSSDSAIFAGTFGAAVAGGDALADATLSVSARVEDGDVVDQVLTAEVRGATPMLGPVRLVGRFTWEGRRNDTSNPFVTLGGDNGLRGFVSQAFGVQNGNLLRGNVELRTAPIELWSLHLGGLLFYDFGAVYTDRHEIALHHGVGVGIRLLFPQFNRTPFRFDFGVPAEGNHRPVPSFGGLQVVPLTPLDELG